MDVVDLGGDHVPLYLQCLEDWSDEMKEAGPTKGQWFAWARERGLRVKLARDDRGVVGGMIQYLPIEYSFVDGTGLWFAPCIWVHGYKEGRGDHRKAGMGRALLAAAEQDAKERGAKGLVAWGLRIPVWMRASWFRRRGYETADKLGLQALVWKRFAPDAQPPRFFRTPKLVPAKAPGRVKVTAYVNGWCPGQNIAFERLRRAASEFGDKIEFERVDTREREAVARTGLSDALFVDGQLIGGGPPPAYEKLRRLLEKRVRRLPKA